MAGDRASLARRRAAKWYVGAATGERRTTASPFLLSLATNIWYTGIHYVIELFAMNMLIIYGSYSGGTMMAAEYLRDVLEEAGQTVTVRRVEDAALADLSHQDLVVLGSCSWDRTLPDGRRLEGQVQECFTEFFAQLTKANLRGRQFAMFALGDSRFFTHFCGAAQHLEHFVEQVGGRVLVPTLRIDQFFFERSANEEKIRGWADSIVSAGEGVSREKKLSLRGKF